VTTVSPRTDRTPRRRLDPDQRRDAIMDAAALAFAAAPYPEVSVVAVADRAGASQALVHKYFDGKAGLYADAVQRELDARADRWRAAVAALGAHAPARDRVRALLLVQLDHLAAAPTAWASPLLARGDEPAAALGVRQEARAALVEELRGLLLPDGTLRRDYALWGFLGFLDGACAAWLGRGCPADERWSLVDAALGALEGALGDWGG